MTRAIIEYALNLGAIAALFVVAAFAASVLS